MQSELIIDYIVSLTNLYGIVLKEKVVEIYNMQNDDRITMEVLDDLITGNTLETSYIEELNNAYMKEYLNQDDSSLITLVELQEDKPFYIPDKDELLKYKDEFYFEKSKEYRDLENYIKSNIESDEDTLEEICEDIHIWCEDDIALLEDVLYAFERRGIVFKDDKQITGLISLVTQLANNTRLREHRGHTPEEIAKIPRRVVAKKEKIGRNDPCPCGSGKKYKKCCIDK